jgi:hypothetical protein
LNHSFSSGASGFTKSGPTMVHPVVKKITATRQATDALKKPLGLFSKDVLLNNFNSIKKPLCNVGLIFRRFNPYQTF